MMLYIDETENEQYFIVVGLLVNSKYDVDMSFKRFKKQAQKVLTNPKYKGLVLTEFKSTLLDRSYHKIKRKMLREIQSLEKRIIYSCYLKKDSVLKQSIKEKTYIKSINPLSFNQKNLNNINLFYNTNTEIFVINYLVLDKIFSLVRYCFKEIIKQKNKELGNRLGNNSKNFVLNNSVFDEFVFEPETNEENILRKMLKKKEFIINLSKQKNKMKLSKAKSRDINNKKYKNYDASKIISENYNINNLYGKSMNNNHEGDENYLKNQILKINIHNNNNKSLIRNNSVKIIGS